MVCHVMSSLGKLFLYQGACTTSLNVLYHSEQHVECLSFSCSIILFLSASHFISTSTSEIVSVAAESISLTVSSSQCGYSYGCNAQLLGIFFRALHYPYLLGEHGQVL